LVTEHPFENGNEYNRVLAAAAESDALGWHGTLGFAAADGRQGELAVALTDRAGRPLDGLSVSAVVTRPVEPLPDILLPLADVGGGRYQARLALSKPGQWEVRVAASRGTEIFQFAQRIVVK
jgi:nitrogen fixation protein FixH